MLYKYISETEINEQPIFIRAVETYEVPIEKTETQSENISSLSRLRQKLNPTAEAAVATVAVETEEITQDVIITNPTDEDLRKAGYKELVETEMPETKDGYYRTKIYTDGDVITQSWSDEIKVDEVKE